MNEILNDWKPFLRVLSQFCIFKQANCFVLGLFKIIFFCGAWAGLIGSDEGYELYRGIKASWHSHWLEQLIYTDNV